MYTTLTQSCIERDTNFRFGGVEWLEYFLETFSILKFDRDSSLLVIKTKSE